MNRLGRLGFVILGLVMAGVLSPLSESRAQDTRAPYFTPFTPGRGQPTGERLQNAAVANGNGTTLNTAYVSTVTFQIFGGAFVATVNFEGSLDNSNWSPLQCYQPGNSSGSSTSVNLQGFWRCNVTGIAVVRARISVYVSGTITIWAFGTAMQLPVLTP